MPGLDCAPLLKDIRIREGDPDLMRQFRYFPQVEPIPAARRDYFNPFNIMDSTSLVPVSLDDFAGKYVYIDLWASWCAPCRAEMPFIHRLRRQYADQDLAIVSISLDNPDELDRWGKAREVLQMDWTNWIALDGQRSAFLEGLTFKGLPMYLLLDKKGRIMLSDAPRPSDTRIHDVLKAVLAGEED